MILYPHKIKKQIENNMRHITPEQVRVIKKLVGYRGRKIRFKEYQVGMSLNSYWDSGSRDYFYWIKAPNILSTPTLYSVVPQNGTPYDKLNLKTLENSDSENLLLVEKVVFRGKDIGIAIYSK